MSNTLRRGKKTSTTVLGIVFAASLAFPSFQTRAQAVPNNVPFEPAFKDVNVGDNHYIAIKFLKDRHIIDGYEDGTFQPEREINRAEALKIILGTISRPAQKTATTAPRKFADVPADAWYATFVTKGLENGIISGYPDGLFHPEQTIKKIESLKMVLLEENHELPVAITEPPYSDTPVDEWFTPYAQVSKDRGLFLENRSAGALEPANSLNRGDFAELIYRLLESSNGYKFGRATYYSDILAGRGTSSGDPYDPRIYTAAHKTLPFGTMLRVTNLANGQSMDVKVNDRGPYATGVELDLSKSAFSALASPSTGIIVTQFTILSQP